MDFWQISFFSLFAVLFAFGPSSASAPNISYHIDWRQPNSHLLEISITINDLSEDSVVVRLPNWRPGRYIMQNFAKDVIAFGAQDSAGNSLPFQKIDKSTWQIEHGQTQTVTVEYSYYAHQLDAGASYIDDSEVYVNPVTCLMYIPGREMEPVGLSIANPNNWKLAIAADQDSSGQFHFDNYHEIIDTPFLLSPDLKLFGFEAKGAKIEIAIQGRANYDSTKLLADLEKIVLFQMDLMQDVPVSRFVFLYHFVPWRMGHGVEHKNSTSIVAGPADFDNEEFYRRFLGTSAHEFFHVWNVERIRPEAIYYPDYSVENYTSTMWMYEGFTSYYDDLTLLHTGLVKLEDLLKNWARQIEYFQGTYGRKRMSVSEVSWNSWVKDMGQAPPNSSFSYYTKGSLIGMLLDLEIRQRTKNEKSLDDVMRYLNDQYAKQNRGVPENGMQMAVETVTGENFNEFFDAYVHGTAELDYNRFLDYAGLTLETKVNKKGPQVYVGIRTDGDEKQTTITNVMPESPAFKAGLDVDDILLAIDGVRAHTENLSLLLRAYEPGDSVRVTVFRREMLREVEVVLGEALPDEYKIVKQEKTSKSQNRIRESWLKEDEEDKKG